jgi:hypothetical protein
VHSEDAQESAVGRRARTPAARTHREARDELPALEARGGVFAGVRILRRHDVRLHARRLLRIRRAAASAGVRRRGAPRSTATLQQRKAEHVPSRGATWRGARPGRGRSRRTRHPAQQLRLPGRRRTRASRGAPWLQTPRRRRRCRSATVNVQQGAPVSRRLVGATARLLASTHRALQLRLRPASVMRQRRRQLRQRRGRVRPARAALRSAEAHADAQGHALAAHVAPHQPPRAARGCWWSRALSSSVTAPLACLALFCTRAAARSTRAGDARRRPHAAAASPVTACASALACTR